MTDPRAVAREAETLVDTWVDHPEAAQARLAQRPGDVGAVFAAAGEAAPQHAVLDAETVAFAVEASHGAVLWSDPRFRDWVGPEFRAPAAVGEDVAVELIDGVGGATMLVAAVARRTAQSWTLPADAIAALAAPQAARLLAVVWSGGAQAALVRAGAAFGLTGMEARVGAALVATGDLRAAAQRAGLSYETARVALKAALAKAGARRQSDLVTRLCRAAAAPIAAGDEAACLRDLFGLTPRDARLAVAMAAGLTRKEAARSVGVSEALAKDAYARVFRRLGVRTAAELGRLLVEARAMALLARPSGGQIVVAVTAHEPLQFIPRGDGGLIAISDFGPKQGRPIFVLHQVTMTRYPSRPLVSALQSAGYRPITLDRPGYGLSDMPVAPSEDPFLDAAHDMARVCDVLGLDRVDALARTAAHTVLAFAATYPDRIGRVVLMSPDPLLPASAKRSGPLGVIKEMLARHPDWIAPMARFFASQATPERVRSNLERALRSSPADLAAMSDPGNLEDYQRGVLMLTTGQLIGLVREQRAFAMSSPRAPLTDASNWRVLVGVQDVITAVDDMVAYWTRLLPGAAFERIEDGGRFLHLSHLPRVLDALVGEGECAR